MFEEKKKKTLNFKEEKTEGTVQIFQKERHTDGATKAEVSFKKEREEFRFEILCVHGWICLQKAHVPRKTPPPTTTVSRKGQIFKTKKSNTHRLGKKSSIFYDQHQQCYKSTNTVSLAPKKVQILYIKKVDTVN